MIDHSVNKRRNVFPRLVPSPELFSLEIEQRLSVAKDLDTTDAAAEKRYLEFQEQVGIPSERGSSAAGSAARIRADSPEFRDSPFVSGSRPPSSGKKSAAAIKEEEPRLSTPESSALKPRSGKVPR